MSLWQFYLERQFPEMHTRSPAGIAAAPHLPNGPYADVRGAHIFAWRPHHWYSWMWEVGRGRAPPTPKRCLLLPAALTWLRVRAWRGAVVRVRACLHLAAPLFR